MIGEEIVSYRELWFPDNDQELVRETLETLGREHFILCAIRPGLGGNWYWLVQRLRSGGQSLSA